MLAMKTWHNEITGLALLLAMPSTLDRFLAWLLRILGGAETLAAWRVETTLAAWILGILVAVIVLSHHQEQRARLAELESQEAQRRRAEQPADWRTDPEQPAPWHR